MQTSVTHQLNIFNTKQYNFFYKNDGPKSFYYQSAKTTKLKSNVKWFNTELKAQVRDNSVLNESLKVFKNESQDD